METAVVVALITGCVTGLGWLVNHWLTSYKEERKRRTESELKYVERQIEELYGPLAFLLYEGRRTFNDLLDTLGRKYVFKNNDPLPAHEHDVWMFWVESDLLPRNESIRKLLMSKAHLIEGSGFPESHVAFLDHCNSWAINHRRWTEKGVAYSWHSKINWPRAFEQDVLKEFVDLKARHSILVGKLGAREQSTWRHLLGRHGREEAPLPAVKRRPPQSPYRAP